MRLVIGSDHAGWPLKQAVIDHIRSLGHEVVDVGSYDEKPVDFPDIARAVAEKIRRAKSRAASWCAAPASARRLRPTR